jgi:hypothetical protein
MSESPGTPGADNPQRSLEVKLAVLAERIAVARRVIDAQQALLERLWAASAAAFIVLRS